VRRERREHDDAAGAHRRRDGVVGVLEALVAERRDEAMRERALAVQAGHHPRAAALLGRVGQRQPARQVLLRLDVGVAIVLVPREAARLLGLLVDRLVPVEVHVVADQVVADAGDRRVRGEASQHR
jgi:hypothetical protein